ncbi:hypothetical protein ScPMuIL_017856 [Solemya velum]
MALPDTLFKLVNVVFESFTSDNDTFQNGTRLNCRAAISHQDFYVYLLIPAVFLTLLFSFTKKRKYRLRNVLYGRPAFVYPMDIMSKSDRFSQTASFGVIATLCADVVFEQKYAIDYEGPTYLKVFVALLSMLVYGLGYVPLFTSVAVRSTLGYVLGGFYAWMLTAIAFYLIFLCDWEPVVMALILAQNLPQLLCLLYLSVSLPLRGARRVYKQRTSKKHVDPTSIDGMVDRIRKSYQGVHVTTLFSKPRRKIGKPITVIGKIISTMKILRDKFIYKKLKNFRYSGRVLAVMLVGIILIYSTSMKLLLVVLPIFEKSDQFFTHQFDQIGYENGPNDTEIDVKVRETLSLAWYVVTAVQGCVLTSVTVACLSGILMILHAMTSIRADILALYRGDYSNLPRAETLNNAGLLVGCMRYAGYQVGYIGWGFVVQFIICFLVTFVLAVLITLIRWGITDWLVEILMTVWPAVLVTLVLYIVQRLLAKFLFLRDSANSLAINNRRVFFIFVYFMFFYNIFLGLVSCLLRIVKSVVIGALFLPRLDRSTLPRRFEFFDPGFAAYLGFIHVEKAHTHPVAIVFCKILLAMYHDSVKEMTSADPESLTEKETRKSKRRQAARSQWLMIYTLHSNPQLQLLRKDYIEKTKKRRNLGVEGKKTIEFLANSSLPMDLKNNNIITSSRL